ncbi:Ethanolamine-phosphate cytidylyltransferase [Carex littledalei]|uniref:Ethanolamine-phosphate cytidylyltransferase n=1 Tax=Carex littledalei TaxID=544730 RepID=A0A833QYF2_9POAL|nr:Ethanolamine-phosphate cytidylyltransferase [Carex littledalei]
MESSVQGAHRPIMNLHERSLSVLACRYVDEVIIGSPREVSKDMITTFNISLVVHGTIAKNMGFMKDQPNTYRVPMDMGIFKQLESPLNITTIHCKKSTTTLEQIFNQNNDIRTTLEHDQNSDRIQTGPWTGPDSVNLDHSPSTGLDQPQKIRTAGPGPFKPVDQWEPWTGQVWTEPDRTGPFAKH